MAQLTTSYAFFAMLSNWKTGKVPFGECESHSRQASLSQAKQQACKLDSKGACHTVLQTCLHDLNFTGRRGLNKMLYCLSGLKHPETRRLVELPRLDTGPYLARMKQTTSTLFWPNFYRNPANKTYEQNMYDKPNKQKHIYRVKHCRVLSFNSCLHNT